MNILFFPSDAGGGFGHINRCLALAQEAKRKGHKCAFVLSSNRFKERLPDELQVFSAAITSRWRASISRLRERIEKSYRNGDPIFIQLSGLDYQVIRDGLLNEKIVEKVISQYVQIVKMFKPNVLVGDTNLLASVVARKMNIPIVQIVQSTYHPINGKLIWWENTDERLMPPRAALLFNPILEKMGLEPVKRAEELLKGELYIIPSIPDIEPMPMDEKTFHVGALTAPGKNDYIPLWFRDINNRHPLVYVTIGGGAGHVGNKSFFSTVIKAFNNEDIQVVISAGGKITPNKCPALSQNIRLLKWVPGNLLISRADLIIFHGGFSTMMESIDCGKPAIALPFHSEQEGNGRRLEQVGCGCVVKMSRDSYKQVKSKWKYGTYSLLVQNRYDLTPTELIEKVHSILFNPEYHKNAQKMKSKLKTYNGPEKAMKLIEQYC